MKRFNRNLKAKCGNVSRILTYRYVDGLDQLVHSYSHTNCSNIKRAPVHMKPENESHAWFSLDGGIENAKRKPCVLQIGDVLRMSKQKLAFKKRCETRWTEELFVMTECVPSRGLHGPDFLDRVRPGPHGCNLGLARPEREIEI